MSNSTHLEKQIFKEGVASDFINRIVEHLPNIMFVASIVIRAVIGYLLWMHAMTMFSYIKNGKVQWLVATLLVGATEVIFTTFSLASAKLRREGGELKNTSTEIEEVTTSNSDQKVRKLRVTNRVTYTQGKKLITWANTLFIVTLVGSLGFNALMLVWTHESGSTDYFKHIEHPDKLQIFVQVMNLIAVFTSEASAFILNSSASIEQEQKRLRVTKSPSSGAPTDSLGIDLDHLMEDISSGESVKAG